jgi:hypothetical protein
MSFTAASTTLPSRLDVLPVMENDESKEDKINKHIKTYIKNSYSTKFYRYLLPGHAVYWIPQKFFSGLEEISHDVKKVGERLDPNF